MKKRIIATLIVFAALLIAFNIYSTRINFTDFTQYLNVAKEFAGIATSKVRSINGYAYGLILGQALKFSPTLLTAKLFNASWLFLDGILLYLITRRWSSLLLWMFSPIVWYMASWISPLMPVSFLLLFAHYNIKLFEKTNKKKYITLSALSMGLASTLWWAAVYISLFFVLSYLINKKLILTILFGIFYSLTFSLRFILDQYLFKMFFFSSFRKLGSHVITSIGQVGTGLPLVSHLFQFSLLDKVIALVIISPILYKFYRVNPFENAKDYLFLFLTFALFILVGQLRYFIVLSPIIILLMTPILSKKEIKLHILISLILIIFITKPYFGETQDSLITLDLKQLEKDYPNESFIVGSDKSPTEQSALLSSLYWGDKIKEFVEYEEYALALKNESVFRSYSLASESKINDLRKIDLTLRYLRTDDRDYKDVKLLIIVGDQEPPKGFKLAKKYEILKVFQKV